MAAKKKEEKKEKESSTEAKEEKKDVSKKVQSIVDDVKELSVLELSDLVNTLQDELGVSAMPVAGPAPAAAGVGEEAAKEGGDGGPTSLTLKSAGDKKIAVIKALRGINQNWGLKEAKEMAEGAPTEVLKDAKPEEVKEAAEKLKEAGAEVETK